MCAVADIREMFNQIDLVLNTNSLNLQFIFMKSIYFILILVVFSIPTQVYADISLLIHEAKGFSGEMTGSGHISVYISDLCTDPPLVLRQCKPNEPQGLVISSYLGFGTKTEYGWFAIPIVNYLYGVENAEQIPLYSNRKIQELLRETNRAKYLGNLIPRLPNEKLPPGRWTELFGAALDRDLYAFTVKTTLEQDLRFLKKYHISPSESDFNLITNNCADFAKNIINFYFPESVSRDFINDFGITTPKALAHSFKNYATKRPNLRFHINKYSQLDGAIARSSDLQHFTEKAFKSKKYVALQVFTMPILLPVFAGTYYLTGGHFNIDKTYRKYPSVKIAQLDLATKDISKLSRQNGVFNEIKMRQTAEKSHLFGENTLWKNYRQKFSEILKLAIKDKIFADNNEVNSFYNDLETHSEPVYDNYGDLVLKVKNNGKEIYLGLTRRNIISPDSDVHLAYKLMLVKVKYQLNAPEKNRETMEVFQANWQLLTELSKSLTELEPFQNRNNSQFSNTSKGQTLENKVQKIFQKITN